MDRPGVRQVPEGSGEQGKVEKTGCKIICGAPMTLAVKGLMMIRNIQHTHWHHAVFTGDFTVDIIIRISINNSRPPETNKWEAKVPFLVVLMKRQLQEHMLLQMFHYSKHTLGMFLCCNILLP